MSDVTALCRAVVCMEPGEERDAGILYPGRGQ